MLYTRLENRRLNNIMKEMKRSEALGSSDEENTVNNKVSRFPAAFRWYSRCISGVFPWYSRSIWFTLNGSF